MSDDDWVARLLSTVDSPPMPDDVAARLDRTLREQVEARADEEPPGEERPGQQPARQDDGAQDDGGRVVGMEETAAAAATPGFLVPPPATPHLRRVGAGDPSTGSTESDDGTSSTSSTDSRAATAPAATRAVGSGTVGVGGPRSLGSSRRELREEDAGERRRRLLTRLAPVAAGLLVLGGAGAVAVNTLGDGSDSADSTGTEAFAPAEDTSVPRALVATGTEYTTTDEELFAQQVRDLVAVAGSGDDAGEAAGTSALGAPEADSGAGAAEGGAAEGSVDPDDSPAAAAEESLPEPGAARSAVDSPLTDREVFDACVEQVTAGGTSPVSAVDLAVVDGLEATVLVVPDPAGDNLLVYVVGPDCTGVDGTQFQFLTVSP